MLPIPLSIRARMEADPFYKTCVIRDWSCEGRIEWHHVFIYAGARIQEQWAILPVCHKHHEDVKRDIDTKDLLEFISLRRASPADLAVYPRKDWPQLRSYLHTKYG